MKRTEADATRALDPKLAEKLGLAAMPFSVGAPGGGVAGHLLSPAVGAARVPVSFDVVPWRIGERLRLSVVVKATFGILASDGYPAGAPREAEPFRTADLHHKNQPLAHVVAASDRAPWKVAVDVTALGHAFTPRGVPGPEAHARFLVQQGGRAVVDKVVRVVGDREKPEDKPAPFTKMPIVYQKAFGGFGAPANPIGVSGQDDEQPNVLDPQNAWRPAGFGPIAAAWPLRSKLLGDVPRRAIDAPIVELPAGFAFAYFQSAPQDQQIGELLPDASITLQGFHPELDRVEVTLPSPRAVGAIYGLDAADEGAPALLRFRADTLHVDADRWLATVTFRAFVDVESEARIARILVAVGVGLGGQDPIIPERRPTGAAAAPVVVARAPSLPPPASKPTGTLDLPGSGAEKITLPFGAQAVAASPVVGLPASPAPMLSPLPGPAFIPGPAPTIGDQLAEPSAPPSRPGPAASAFFHDLSKLRGVEAPGVVPRAKDAALEPPKPHELVDLERYAEICGAVDDKAEVPAALAERKIDAAAYREAERHWRRALAFEQNRAGQELRDRFDVAFVASWEVKHPGRFERAHYDRLVEAQKKGILQVEMRDQKLDPALGMRLRRVWRKRVQEARA